MYTGDVAYVVWVIVIYSCMIMMIQYYYPHHICHITCVHLLAITPPASFFIGIWLYSRCVMRTTVHGEISLVLGIKTKLVDRNIEIVQGASEPEPPIIARSPSWKQLVDNN
jgi:hypothetical protein